MQIHNKATGISVDQDRIINAVRSIDLHSDEHGLIKFFGVYLTYLFTEFYNDFSFEFERAGEDAVGIEGRDTIEGLLVHAAQECGLETMNAVMKSGEWIEFVEPMIKTSEDKVHALVAIANSFAWGNLEARLIVPGKELIINAYDSYEALGYLKKYGRSTRPRCYMLRGVAGSIMDLVYGEKPFPDNLETFQSVQTKCISMGDRYCEFYVTRA
jgi:hypothetical protein